MHSVKKGGGALLDIYSKELKTGTQIITCAYMFIAALFTIAKRLKQPNVHQWMNGETNCGIFRQWAIIWSQQRNEVLISATTWMIVSATLC